MSQRKHTQRNRDGSKDLNDPEGFAVSTQLYVPAALYGGLIGREGKTKRRIESESDVSISIPSSRRAHNSMITIKGRTDENVCKAKKAIEALLLSLRKTRFPTHFTCVPAVTDEMKKSFYQIKENILSDKYAGIDESLFVSDGKIHITFAVCTLLDSEDRDKAVEIFKECSKKLVDEKTKIEITVQGLKKFDDEPSTKVRVLFAGVESTALQTFANQLMKSFKDANLCFEDRGDNVYLHLTIMNSKNRKKVNPKEDKWFDATEILRKYGDYYFGSFSIAEIHLSEMGTEDEKGFYKSICTVSV